MRKINLMPYFWLLSTLIFTSYSCSDGTTPVGKTVVPKPTPSPAAAIQNINNTQNSNINSANNTGTVPNNATPQNPNPQCQTRYTCATWLECRNIYLCNSEANCEAMLKVRPFGYLPATAPTDEQGAPLALCGSDLIPTGSYCMRESFKQCWSTYTAGSTAKPASETVLQPNVPAAQADPMSGLATLFGSLINNKAPATTATDSTAATAKADADKAAAAAAATTISTNNPAPAIDPNQLILSGNTVEPPKILAPVTTTTTQFNCAQYNSRGSILCEMKGKCIYTPSNGACTNK